MSQKSRMKELFQRRANEWIPLYDILDMTPRIASHTKAISEVRASGMTIECKYRFKAGALHTWYRWETTDQPVLF